MNHVHVLDQPLNMKMNAHVFSTLHSIIKQLYNGGLVLEITSRFRFQDFNSSYRAQSVKLLIESPGLRRLKFKAWLFSGSARVNSAASSLLNLLTLEGHGLTSQTRRALY